MTNANQNFDTTSNNADQSADQSADSTQARRFTRKAAVYRISLLKARIDRANTELDEAKCELVQLEEILPTLPEVIATPAYIHEVGKVVSLFVGRETNRRQVEGKVVGIAYNESGAPSRYKIEVGTGFDSEFFTVFPGSIQDIRAKDEAEGSEPADEDALDAVGAEYGVDGQPAESF